MDPYPDAVLEASRRVETRELVPLVGVTESSASVPTHGLPEVAGSTNAELVSGAQGQRGETKGTEVVGRHQEKRGQRGGGESGGGPSSAVWLLVHAIANFRVGLGENVALSPSLTLQSSRRPHLNSGVGMWTKVKEGRPPLTLAMVLASQSVWISGQDESECCNI